MTDKQKIKQVLKSLRSEATWIGEDGAMACVSKTEQSAFKKFKALMSECVGDYEASELKIDDIGIGWLFLVTNENKDDFESDTEWYVDYVNKSPYEVWVYNA